MKYLILLASFPLYQFGILGTYVGKAGNSGMDGAWKEWKLTLNDNGKFECKVEGFYSMVNYNHAIFGGWTLSTDTLTLKSFDYPFILNFVVKANKLVLISKDSLSNGSGYKIDTLVRT
jgi:hypothetical protein